MSTAAGPTEPLLETAGQHLAARVPHAHADEPVAHVLARLHGDSFDALDAVYVVDREGRLQGLVRLRTLCAASPAQALGAIMDAPPPKVYPEEDQERVASLAIRARIAAVPVVDRSDRLLGVVPPEALIEILRREHIEDLQRFVGIRQHRNQAVHALAAAPLIRARAPAVAARGARGQRRGHLRDDALRGGAVGATRDRFFRPWHCLSRRRHRHPE